MPKPKSTSARNPNAEQAEGVAAEPDDAVGTVTLTAKQQAFLNRTSRFLVGITAPVFAQRARRHGYTVAEHREGWLHWSTAVGKQRPLDHLFVEQQAAATGDADGMVLLKQIDEFENLWFPRVRAIIRRVVDRDRRDEFAEGFFKDMAQQPLGPSVVGSVSVFLRRVKGLEESKDPDAKKVRDTLRKRGLTESAIQQVRGLIEEVETLKAPKDRPADAPSAAEIASAQAAQREAYESLRDWFNDWATMLRPAFNAREQVQLGLAVVRRGGQVAVDEDGDMDAEEADAEDDSVSPEAAAVGGPKER
ncbi:MAG TPA: hypothetical protein VLS89_02365 [Candidatus Nanopelagicales bacterium]|nr:hypothetical protein [Candidatus Nanopelagicales bacterium]